MRAGDLVEFKPGLFGIEPPRNLGIYLEREKRGKQFFAILWTVKGRKEVLTDHLKGVRLSAPLDDTSDDALRSRLEVLLGQAQEKPKGGAAVSSEEMTDRDLWRFANAADEPLAPQRIAELWHKKPPTRKQVEDVRNVLVTCARPGVGYFERVPGREELWRALPPLAYKQVRQEIEGFQALRKKLVAVEEVEDPETGRPRTFFKPIPPASWNLGEDDRRRLLVLKEHMIQFVLNDRDAGLVGLPNDAGFLVHTIDGFRLSEIARWLALDWTGVRGVTLSSAFVQFLVDGGLWKVEEAIVAVAKRKVLRFPEFGWEVPADAVRAAERATVPPDEVARRRDLRGLPTWTIDPADAKDHDDAISIERHPDGRTTLWVHIADVSWFVEKGGTLDHHARKRATSVYLPTGVLPMLPPRLSDDLCSLNAGEDKLAMTAELVYDAGGALVEERFHEAVVRIEANVSYEEVDAAIDRGEEPFASMEAFARLLDGKRRGLAIETGEVRVRVGEAGITHGVKRGTRATKMIEVFMVAANEAVARKLRDAQVACLYRCHPLPDRVSVERFNKQCRTMELDVAIELPEAEAKAEAGGASLLDLLKGGKMEIRGGGLIPMSRAAGGEGGGEGGGDGEGEGGGPGAGPAPVTKGLAQLTEEEREAWLAPFRAALAKVEALKDPRFREIVYVKTLSCMGRAFYTTANLGHFGLGSACYAHFTSPIRRYPDLVVHRQLRALLRGEAPPHGDDLADVAVHCSEQGGAAEETERGVVASVLVFLSRGAAWTGAVDALVNGVTKGGLFLSLPDGLESRVSSSDIPGGPWSVDDAESMLFREQPPDEISAANWREVWNDDLDEAVFVRARLGDRLGVVLAARDFVDGRIAAKLAE